MSNPQKPPTYLAVPADVLMAAINTLSELPYKNVGQLLPALQSCMSDEHRVDFPAQSSSLHAVAESKG